MLTPHKPGMMTWNIVIVTSVFLGEAIVTVKTVFFGHKKSELSEGQTNWIGCPNGNCPASWVCGRNGE
jgi:hypothetical protein